MTTKAYERIDVNRLPLWFERRRISASGLHSNWWIRNYDNADHGDDDDDDDDHDDHENITVHLDVLKNAGNDREILVLENDLTRTL